MLLLACFIKNMCTHCSVVCEILDNLTRDLDFLMSATVYMNIHCEPKKNVAVHLTL